MAGIHIPIEDKYNNSALALRQQGAGYARLDAAPPAPCGASTSPIRILRLPEVITRVGYRKASIYQFVGKGSFPKPIPLGARAVGWLEHEIDAWLLARITARKY